MQAGNSIMSIKPDFRGYIFGLPHFTVNILNITFNISTPLLTKT